MPVLVCVCERRPEIYWVFSRRFSPDFSHFLIFGVTADMWFSPGFFYGTSRRKSPDFSHYLIFLTNWNYHFHLFQTPCHLRQSHMLVDVVAVVSCKTRPLQTTSNKERKKMATNRYSQEQDRCIVGVCAWRSWRCFSSFCVLFFCPFLILLI